MEVYTRDGTTVSLPLAMTRVGMKRVTETFWKGEKEEEEEEEEVFLFYFL